MWEREIHTTLLVSKECTTNYMCMTEAFARNLRITNMHASFCATICQVKWNIAGFIIQASVYSLLESNAMS